MGNPRQRRKARSSAHKVVRHSKHAKRKLRKMKPIQGPKALQDAWDNKKTLRQNYAAMGLARSLRQTDSGGSERPPVSIAPTTSSVPGESSSRMLGKEATSHGRILRDAEGNVIGVELPEDDADESVDEEMAPIDDTIPKTELVDALESLAETARPVQRFSSDGEIVTLKKLVAKHGLDYDAMAKDRPTNEWQRTAGQLKRAIKKAKLI